MKLTIFLSLFFLSFSLFSAEGDDNKSSMKFRGSIFMGMVFYPGHHSNIAENNYSHINMEERDYTDKGDPDFRYHQEGDPGRKWGGGLFGTNGIEGKLFANFVMSAPFLAFDHFLLRNNNIAFGFKFGVSPVSISLGSEVTVTPIPFLLFTGGISIGTGYNIPIATGMARNNYSGEAVKGERMDILKEDSFLGPFISNWVSVTFQFDIAAVMPERYKRWTHVVMRAKAEMNHRMIANLSSDIPFVYENDWGENHNGWYFYMDSMIGYKIPVVIDPVYEELSKSQFIGAKKHNNFSIIAGFMANIDKYNVTHNRMSPMDKKGWGSDFMHVIFGPMALFELPNNLFLVLMFNWKNGRVYTEETVGNADFYKREYDDWYVYFEKIGLVFGWNF